jgi:hypothetical protein
VRRVAILFVFLVLSFQPVYAFSPTFHAGGSGGAGFFSWYTSLEAGIKVDLRKNFALGLTQRVGYGFTYREIVGLTEVRVYLYDDLFIHIGASYLLKPSSYATLDFKTMVLPHLGFGLYIPLDSGRRFFVVPRIEMNQSFYLSDSIRPVYSDLPFLVAGQASIGFECRW